MRPAGTLRTRQVKNGEMHAFDIIVGIPLAYAAYRGFRSGIVAQSCGLLGLVAGVWLASRYGEAAGLWMRVDPSAARVAGFVAILLLTLLGIALLGYLLKGLFRLAGLGPIDAVGGLLLGVVKMALILSLLLGAFETVNRSAGWVGEQSYARAVLYKPVREVSRWVFPYLSRAAEKLADRENTSE